MYNGALADLNLSLNPFNANRYAFGGVGMTFALAVRESAHLCEADSPFGSTP